MKGYRDFIVHIPKKYNDTIETKNGTKLYLDRRFSTKEVAVTTLNVMSSPIKNNTPISSGDKIFIDPTILLLQTFEKTGEQESQYLVDREKNLYRIPEELIIMYCKKESNEWIGLNDNLLCEYEKVKPTDTHTKLDSGLFIPVKKQTPKTDNKFTVKYLNLRIKELGIKIGDSVFIDKEMIIDVWIDGLKLAWIRSKDLLAKSIFLPN